MDKNLLDNTSQFILKILLKTDRLSKILQWMILKTKLTRMNSKIN